jgi:hypothetical protein
VKAEDLIKVLLILPPGLSLDDIINFQKYKDSRAYKEWNKWVKMESEFMSKE